MKTINNYAELVKEKHALNKTLAPVETDLTGASQAYVKGAKFIYNGIMYQAKIDIAQGDALVLNTNYEAADDVETQIANEAATRSAMGAKNFVALNKSPYRAQSTPNVSSISTQTEDELIFTTANGTFAQVLLFYSLPIGTYKVSCNMSSSDSYSPKVGVYLKNGNQDVRNVKISDGETKEFTITNEITHIEIACLGTEAASTAAVRTVTFRNLMIRLATDSDGTYQPYAKTNKELTEEVSSLNTAIANKENTPTVLTATLAAGATTLTFTDASIGNNSRIRAYSDPFVLGLITDMSQSGTTVTLTCAAQASAVSVKLEVRN